MAKKVWSPSEIQKQALELIEKRGKVLFYELKEEIPTLNPSHLTSLVKNGLLTSQEVEREVLTKQLRTINEYELANKE